MFKPHYGDCSNPDCNRKDVIIPVKSGLCQYCNHEKKQRNKNTTISGKSEQGWETFQGLFRKEIDKSFEGDGGGLPQVRKVSKSSPPKARKSIQYRKENTGESEVFKTIWETSEHKCFVCGKAIMEPTASNFAHVIPKALNRYPLFKLHAPNIKLLCHDFYGSCHNRWDKEPRSTLTEPMWKKLFELEEQLKEEYKSLKSNL